MCVLITISGYQKSILFKRGADGFLFETLDLIYLIYKAIYIYVIRKCIYAACLKPAVYFQGGEFEL